MRYAIMFLLLALSLNSVAFDGSGRSGKFDFRQKAQNKEGNRWTLQQWLEQKERNKMMDLWLAMYSPSPYESFISASYFSYTRTNSGSDLRETRQSVIGKLGTFATIIGLVAEYENNWLEKFTDLSGSVNLRIMGNAVQGTHLILQYGIRNKATDISGTNYFFRNQFASADLNIYVSRHFGLLGMYRTFLPYTDLALGEVSGTMSEAGLFVDFGATRVFGNYYQETQEIKDNTASVSSTSRSGINGGLAFYF